MARSVRVAALVAALASVAMAQIACNHMTVDPDTGVELHFSELALVKYAAAPPPTPTPPRTHLPGRASLRAPSVAARRLARPRTRS